jgi:hypothetical protein
MKPLEGIMALTYTPFNEDFTLNEDAVRQEIDWVIKQGATGIWPGTFAGQWPEMDEAVRKGILRSALSMWGGAHFAPLDVTPPIPLLRSVWLIMRRRSVTTVPGFRPLFLAEAPMKRYTNIIA